MSRLIAQNCSTSGVKLQRAHCHASSASWRNRGRSRRSSHLSIASEDLECPVKALKTLAELRLRDDQWWTTMDLWWSEEADEALCIVSLFELHHLWCHGAPDLHHPL